MADIDIDEIQEIIRKEEEAKNPNLKSKRKHSGSRSHDRSSSERNKHKKYKVHKMRGDSFEEDDFKNKIKRQEEALQRQIEEAKKQAEEAQREDCTVQCIRVHLNATERDIYSFFVKANVGKVRDVRVIKDTKTGKSKGVAYVEFYTPESVLLAMALTNQPLLGLPMIIQASQAEINRQAQATKYRQEQQKKTTKRHENMKIYIYGLTSENDVRQVFSPFGEIELIELPRDPYSGKSKKVAFVTFCRRRDAKAAIKEMDGYKVKSTRLEVREAKENESEYYRDMGPDLDLEEKGFTIGSGRSRAALIRELNRGKEETNDLLVKQSDLNAASNCILLNNLFDPTSVDLEKEPHFYREIEDQVLDICEEVGKVDKVWVDTKSQGNVWVKFSKDSIKGAQKAQEMMNNRFFDEREIRASFIPEKIYNAKVPE
ncbi:unnamed protein product [Moneuplotes crassus]|uniref:RRM domain-containing protein n=2 Tax=Euplotes crassus TaxID=5936 RepID=A0AAD1XBL0_EUPCR|nr:unnamed protein product [Moneuplotes crassus]